jgi:UDP-galactopyranose mutase
MSRVARRHRVLFVEEAVDGPAAAIRRRRTPEGVDVVTPVVPTATASGAADAFVASALRDIVASWTTGPLIIWHYSVMAEPLSRALPADVTVFDCMDELSAFRGAAPGLVDRETKLLARADLVFTGGYSLWAAKRLRHPSVLLFPSSVDIAHWSSARSKLPEPEVLSQIPRPRLVYAGVIDERLDYELVRTVADCGAGEVVLIGPLAKIDPSDVPAVPHVHQLGMRSYTELPAFFAHADVGLMPFALNETTRFISPTKTPEYLAAGLPVVSTAIADVVRGYGDLEMVRIAETSERFVAACRDAAARPRRLEEVDVHLAGMSWDATWDSMEAHIVGCIPRSREAA